MERIPLTPRADWQQQFDQIGFHFHSLGDVYWDESVCYRFSSSEIDTIEDATWKLHELCLQAVDHVITTGAFQQFALPDWFIEYLVASWEADEPSLYGRFDLSYDGTQPPKLLEYNADTPTSLIEASIAQWNWQRQVFPEQDQFNLLHEKLIARWKQVKKQLDSPIIYFACVAENPEDSGNVDYLRDTAMQAGIECRHIYVEDIGWSASELCFVDLENNMIATLFKLYPWEWMANEKFGPLLPGARMACIEPAWKTLLSSKAILPILWKLNPGHPNLLPCYTEEASIQLPYVKKPIYSREGENVEIHDGENIIVQPGSYGAEGYIYQAYAALPDFQSNFPVIGSWIIGDDAAGMGIRENHQRITTNTSRFVPHYFN